MSYFLNGMITDQEHRNDKEPNKGLNISLFALGFIGTFITAHLLVVPALLVCILLAVFFKSRRARWAVGSFVLGILVEGFIFFLLIAITGDYQGLLG